MVGALLGIVGARKLPWCKYAFVSDDQRAEVDAYLAWATNPEKVQKIEAVSPSINTEIPEPSTVKKGVSATSGKDNNDLEPQSPAPMVESSPIRVNPVDPSMGAVAVLD